VSSYTENVPSWLFNAGRPEPVRSVHVHALAPGSGDILWDYELPLRGTFRLRSAEIVATGSSFVLHTWFSMGDGTVYGEALASNDASVLALDAVHGTPQWHSVIRGDTGGSGYPAITRLRTVVGNRGEVVVHGSYRRGIAIREAVARAPARYSFTDWSGKRHYDEPEVGFFARLQ
jgi:outer membrane protein assembly factor BamB